MRSIACSHWGPPGAAERARAFFEALAVDPFEARSYGPSAGTNVGG